MARKAAAMPQFVCMNCRRLRPSRLLLTSASSSIRRSTCFCVSLCGGGRYSPLDTICVGIGVAAKLASAPATRRCSRSLSQLLIGVLPCTSLNKTWLLVADAAALDEPASLTTLAKRIPQRQLLRLEKSDHRHADCRCALAASGHAAAA